MQSFLGVLLQIATVASIATATRWLFRTKGAKLPATRDGISLYRVKGARRAVGIGTATFCAALAFGSIRDLPSASGWVSLSLFLALAIAGIWIANGVVITDRLGVTKKVFWRSYSFRWNDITELRLLDKQGGAIEVQAGAERIVIDFRIGAFEHLWMQLIKETGLQRSSERIYVRR